MAIQKHQDQHTMEKNIHSHGHSGLLPTEINQRGGQMKVGKESEKLEFKKTTAELKEGIISITAILNKHSSGELFFGVRNDH